MPSTGKWLDPTVPKDGWTHGGETKRTSVDFPCDMCEAEHGQRTHHFLVHVGWQDTLRCGSRCSALMTGDEVAVNARAYAANKAYFQQEAWKETTALILCIEEGSEGVVETRLKACIAEAENLHARPGTAADKADATDAITRMQTRLREMKQAQREKAALEERERLRRHTIWLRSRRLRHSPVWARNLRVEAAAKQKKEHVRREKARLERQERDEQWRARVQEAEYRQFPLREKADRILASHGNRLNTWCHDFLTNVRTFTHPTQPQRDKMAEIYRQMG